MSDSREQIKEYYSNVSMKEHGEMATSTCACGPEAMPDDIDNNPVLVGECLGGAMYIEGYRRLMTKCGWADFRYMTSSAATIDNKEIEALIGNIEYTSRTIRAFKLPDTVEDICEQYGQTAIYRGGIVGCEKYFDLDDHHRFYKDLRLDVCGNSCTYVQDTRFGKYFEVFDVGFGLRHVTAAPLGTVARFLGT